MSTGRSLILYLVVLCFLSKSIAGQLSPSGSLGYILVVLEQDDRVGLIPLQ